MPILYLRQYKKEKKNPEQKSLSHPQQTASVFHPHLLPTFYPWEKKEKSSVREPT